jgi:hypothetical protein
MNLYSSGWLWNFYCFLHDDFHTSGYNQEPKVQKQKSPLFSSFVRTKWHNSTVSLPNCCIVKAGSGIYT